MKTMPLKESELRKIATCDVCERKIGEQPLPLFYLVTVARYGVDRNAIERKSGLEYFLGSPYLASVMGADEDMALPMMEQGRITVCERCASENPFLHRMAELVNEKTSREGLP
jgi:hypothetical protein